MRKHNCKYKVISNTFKRFCYRTFEEIDIITLQFYQLETNQVPMGGLVAGLAFPPLAYSGLSPPSPRGGDIFSLFFSNLSSPT